MMVDYDIQYIRHFNYEPVTINSTPLEEIEFDYSNGLIVASVPSLHRKKLYWNISNGRLLENPPQLSVIHSDAYRLYDLKFRKISDSVEDFDIKHFFNREYQILTKEGNVVDYFTLDRLNCKILGIDTGHDVERTWDLDGNSNHRYQYDLIMKRRCEPIPFNFQDVIDSDNYIIKTTNGIVVDDLTFCVREKFFTATFKDIYRGYWDLSGEAQKVVQETEQEMYQIPYYDLPMYNLILEDRSDL